MRYEHPPTDLFDAVCRLDDVADWLEKEYPDEARKLRDLSLELQGYIRITLAGDQPSGREP